MKASINGSEQELPDGMTVSQLLVRVQAPPKGIAVAKNDCVVRRSAYDEELVREGDRIEIIKAAAGG